MAGPLAKMRILAFDNPDIFNNAQIPSLGKKGGVFGGFAERVVQQAATSAVSSAIGAVSNAISDTAGFDAAGLLGAIGYYEVMFNPNTYSKSFNYSYKAQQPAGASLADLQYDKIEAGEYSFEFIIDGTGTSGTRRSVFADVESFLSMVGYNGEIHRTRWLLLNWGTLTLRCVIKSVEVSYSLFDSTGFPLRAKMNTTFAESIPVEEIAQIEEPRSPDLSRVVTVQEGDTLPLLAKAVYGDPNLYLEVARANNLSNFRRIPPGTELVFPPIEPTN